VKTARARMIFACLRKAMLPDGAGLTDGQLLRQYFAGRDEAAFAVLVRRHGPMVLGVCRRLLRRIEDAEDAFQAAFIVLARKGRRIAERQTIGGWLHGVAYHVALNVRDRGVRRRAKEQQVEDMPHPIVMPEEDQSELLAKLDRELNRLPEKYRVPVVLCELEGRSRKEAARQLGLAEGTLSSRLATARKTLANRMAGRGLAVGGASLTALLASEAGAAVVSGPLVASTVRAAGGVVSAGVVALAEGVLKAMLLTKIKSAGLVLLFASVIGVGAVGLTYRTATAADSPQPANAPRATAKAANPDKDDLEALRLEVEALRVSLQATRERVKAVEVELHAAKAEALEKPRLNVGFLANPPTFTESALPLQPALPGTTTVAPKSEESPKKPETPPTLKASGYGLAPAAPLPNPTGIQTGPPPASSASGGPTGQLLLSGKLLSWFVVPASSASGAPAGQQAGTKSEAADVQELQAATAELLSHPTNKKAQEAAKRALEKMNMRWSK
jgi:RNA polymerase sigma factor (sigma-70 family)